jgi:NitT/TauT family transport system permease protein
LTERRPITSSVLRRIVVLVAFACLVAVVWEGVKWLSGDPWRLEDVLGTGTSYYHQPPFRVLQANDSNLPHLWTIFGRLAQPFSRNADLSLAGYLLQAAFQTFVEAAIGFVLGAAIGIILASVFVHSRLAERTILPWVIASQALPIVAISPILVLAFARSPVSVVIVATYLTFFPVTIAMARGLRSPDPRMLELMRSYAASTWDAYRKVRLPASVPYLFAGLKVAATASVIGAIIGEGPGGVQAGLGRAIIVYYQQYTSGPERLWATMLAAALLGLFFYSLVRFLEMGVTRGRWQEQPT